MSEDVLYLLVDVKTILVASLSYYVDTTEGLDRALQELVGLETYDELVLLVDISGLV